MKKKLIIVLFSLIANSIFAQSKQVKFEKAVHDIFNLAAAGNLESINEKYIHRDYKLFVMYRIGVPDVMSTVEELTKDSVYSSPYFYLSSVENTKRKLMLSNVDFECDKEQWTSQGLFYQKRVPKQMTKIMAFLTKYEEVKYDAGYINKVKFIEQNSYRVVDTKSNVVFFLTWIKNEWYVTVFDLVSMDCSA